MCICTLYSGCYNMCWKQLAAFDNAQWCVLSLSGMLRMATMGDVCNQVVRDADWSAVS
jgi:hypothetical protein